MDLISELENEFNALTQAQPVSHIAVRVAGQIMKLELAQLGIDYLAGTIDRHLVIIPSPGVSQVMGSYLPEQTERSLVELLSGIRSPVRIRFKTATEDGACWLLNIRSNWIRVSGNRGISWIPLSAIQSIEVLAVDN